jgi:tetratricopeptide (TPR) repeat protein
MTTAILAGAEWEQGRFEEARALYEQALALHREIGDRRNEGVALGNLAGILLHQGRLEEAGQCCEQALAVHRAVGNRRSIGNALNNLSGVRQAQGRLAEARRLLDESLEVLGETGDCFYQAHALLALAVLERYSGSGPEPPERFLDEAEGRFRQLGNDALVARCLCQRGHIDLAHGRPARQRLEQAEAHAARKPQGGADHELRQSLTGLRRAVEAFEAGRPLVRGEVPEDLPPGLQRWLTLRSDGKAPEQG